MSFRLLAIHASLLLCFSLSALQAVPFNPGARPPYAAAILVEAESGTVLFDYNAHAKRSPASTLKLLLELVVMDQLEQGKITLQDSIRVSVRASRVGGSQVFLKAEEVFPLSELMAAIILPSGNDACVAVAEHIAGSVEGFVDMMNAKAQEIGLKDTHCVNVHGLDDTPTDSGNQTTAYDLAQIARHLLHYPHVLEWSSSVTRPFREGKFILHNTNKLLTKFDGMDGLKTGYTGRAGFCLVATARRNGMRLISVLLGNPNSRVREQETARLLTWGFNSFIAVPVARAGESLSQIPLSWGLEPEVGAVSREAVVAVVKPEQKSQLDQQLFLPAELSAPVRAGDPLGTLKVTLGDSLLAEVPLVAGKSIGRMNLWQKLKSYF
jgi:serine-type D-Ala-D-Ala carboxypeptidase (penicillin-binding protein 5/6)